MAWASKNLAITVTMALATGGIVGSYLGL